MQNHFSIGVGVEAVEETYPEGADRRDKRVGGTRVYSLGFIGEKGHEAGSVFSDPGAALADRAVFCRPQLSLLRGSDQPLGDGGRGVVALATRAVWERGEGA